MRKTALVIMAAGIGSRYGAGVKQLAKVGPSGEIIIDYSIHDALEAGFDKIVFIIRKDIEDDFREVIGDRVAKLTEVSYAFQDLDDLPEGYTPTEGRTKPWGTAQAVWAARKVIDCPFLVINADDFYGASAFRLMHDYLVNEMDESEDTMDFCMAGYVLGNTLSGTGSVCRGVCEQDDRGYLVTVRETYNICKGPDGTIRGEDISGKEYVLDEGALVSMNMWGLKPNAVKAMGDQFPVFLDRLAEGDIKSEFLLPDEVDRLVRTGLATVKVIPVNEIWYGVTYREDVKEISEAIAAMVADNIYGERLFD